MQTRWASLPEPPMPCGPASSGLPMANWLPWPPCPSLLVPTLTAPWKGKGFWVTARARGFLGSSQTLLGSSLRSQTEMTHFQGQPSGTFRCPISYFIIL